MKKLISLLLTVTMLFTMTACSKAEASWQEKYDAGLRYLNDLDYESAIQAFNEAIEIDPEQQAAYESLIEAQTAMDNANRPDEKTDESSESQDEITCATGFIPFEVPIVDPIELDFDEDGNVIYAGSDDDTSPSSEATDNVDDTSQSTEQDETVTDNNEPVLEMFYTPEMPVVGPGGIPQQIETPGEDTTSTEQTDATESAESTDDETEVSIEIGEGRGWDDE